MLDLDQMQAATPEERRQMVIQRILREVPEIIARKGIRDFDRDKFSSDLKTWFDLMNGRE
jgi:hypothetical protein